VALGQVFSPSSSVFPCQFHSTGSPLLGKGQKDTITKGTIISKANIFGPRWRNWLRQCATNRKGAGSIHDGVIGIFH
jgi:hypothetical protein